MHRHSYQGRKLSRARDQREALLRSLATSLVLHEQIQTTLAKAKEVAPYVERVVTYAKQNTLANQRQLRIMLLTENAVQKMIQELAPAFKERQGGYTRVIKAGHRRGDNAPMAVVSLVLPARLVAKSSQEAGEGSEGTKQPKVEAKTPTSHSSLPTAKKSKPKAKAGKK
jgi:large subunit ribosomal protein L17